MRYWECVWYVRVYRWWRYRPLGMVKAIIGILLWISTGASLTKDDSKYIGEPGYQSPEYCTSRWAMIKWTFRTFNSLASIDMGNTFTLEEAMASLHEQT